MTLNDIRWYLEHSMFLNYMLGCFVTCGTIWIINKILEDK